VGHPADLGRGPFPPLGYDLFPLENIVEMQFQFDIAIRTQQVTGFNQCLGVDKLPVVEGELTGSDTRGSQVLHVKDRIQHPEHTRELKVSGQDIAYLPGNEGDRLRPFQGYGRLHRYGHPPRCGGVDV